MNKNIAVSIYGATGFTGRELLKILCRHKGVRIDKLYSRSYAGSRISDIFPALKGVIDKKLSSPDPKKVPLNSDAVFLALPHMKSMEYVPRLRDKGILTVDMSADYRFSDWGAYEKEYGCRHTDRENIKKAVYGLSEINRESIREASLIANPGCYATALILALYPLLKKKLLIGPAYADAKSGISGAGKKLHENFLFASRNENLTPYKVNTHRHRGEVKEFLSGACSGRWSGLVFCPHLIPMERGILANIYAQSNKEISWEKLRDIYMEYYGKEKFINICGRDSFPQTSDTVGTNNCSIGISVCEKEKTLVVIAAIDNLLKGASGQAVQNLNIAMGFNEWEGLI